MKKVLSVILLMVFLFNVGGYYIVFWGLRLETDQQLTERLDAGRYDPDATLELKIPVTLPYPVYTFDFERVDGRFEHKGEFYKLVKHKFQNDTLYIVCIRDQQTRALVNTMNNYVRLTHSLPAAPNKAHSFLDILAKEFFGVAGFGVVHRGGFDAVLPFFYLSTLFTAPSVPVDGPPPEA